MTMTDDDNAVADVLPAGFTELNDVATLFRVAANNEPLLIDDNFTKVVINCLPHKSTLQRRGTRTRWLPDMLGLFVAIIAIIWLTNLQDIGVAVSTLVPSSIVISLPNIVGAAAMLIVTAIMGWWVVERDG